MGWMDEAANIGAGVATGGLSFLTDPNAGSDILNGDIDNLIPGVRRSKEAEAEYQRRAQAIVDRIEKEWKLPQYDQTPLTPEEYTVLNMYAPQVAGFVQQQAPQLLVNINGPGQQAQTQALNQLGTLAQTGVDAGTRAQYEEANLSADQALRSNRANALANLNSRGLGSSGATLGADIGAGLGAAEQQRMASVQAARDAAQRKLQAIQGLGNLGSTVAGQQQQQEEFNANTLNQYNQLLANRRQQYNEYAAGLQNQANMYNQQQTQGTANANTGLRNQANEYNRNRADMITNNMTNSQNERLRLESGIQSGSSQNAYNYGMQQSQNQTGMFMGLLGLGGAAAMNAGGGGSGGGGGYSNPSGSDVNYGNANPNYNFGGGGAGGGGIPYGLIGEAI